jgi:hypothetical protein
MATSKKEFAGHIPLKKMHFFAFLPAVILARTGSWQKWMYFPHGQLIFVYLPG